MRTKVMRMLQKIYVSKEGANEKKGRGKPGAWTTALGSNGEPFLLEQSRPWQRKEEKKDLK